MALLLNISSFRSRTKRCLDILTLAYLALLLASVAPAHAAERWSLSPIQNPSGGNKLLEIACAPATANSCTAIGTNTVSGVDKPLIERWDGFNWSVQAAPTPAGATQTRFFGVSCPSTTSCFAVGQYSTSGGSFSLAERWNGSSWSILATPNPAGSTWTQLTTLSCATATACTAVGYSTVGSSVIAIAERWNGTSWTLQSVPLPSGAISGQLEGVACPEVSLCVAVGKFTDSTGWPRSLSLVWNGSTWSVKSMVEPAERRETTLLDVSCSAAIACTAVGGWKNNSGTQFTYVQRWNGTSWTLQSSPNEATSKASVLQKVACTTSTNCVAVGNWISSTGGSNQTLAEVWDDNLWKIEKSYNPAGATFSAFFGLACGSESATCLGVGYSTDSTGRNLALGAIRRAGWGQSPAPNPAGSVYALLTDVACTASPTETCFAIGDALGESYPSGAAVYRWSGAKWEHQPTPEIEKEHQLYAISCTSTSSCVAVGKQNAEHWNGSTWVAKTTPNPGELEDVSCSSSTACTAVGRYYDPLGIAHAFAVRWNGTSWTSQVLPLSSSELTALVGVSCVSTTWCVAVGHKAVVGSGEEGGTFGPFKDVVLTWNGTTWTSQVVPETTGSTDSLPAGVSCSSSSACTVVGMYTTTSGPLPFALRWNGTSWTLQPIALPPGASFGRLEEVSCSSNTACMAVGDYEASDFSHWPMAQRWVGSSWVAQKPPAPASGPLFSVSCLASNLCWGVGRYINETSYVLIDGYLG